jgi:hypothetical protein
MSFKGFSVSKLNGNLGGVNPTGDGIGMLVSVVPLSAIEGGGVHWAPMELYKPADAAAYGITQSFDDNSGLTTFMTIEEHFRLAPESKLWLMLVPNMDDPEDEVEFNAADIFSHENFYPALKIAKDVKFITYIGYMHAADRVIEQADLVNTIQSRIDFWASENRLIDWVILEGRGPDIPITVADYPDLREKTARNVSVCIAQDVMKANFFPRYADIGAVSGMIAIRQVNENIGSVDIIKKPSAKKANKDYSLTEGNRWVLAALCDGTLVSSLTQAELKSLNDKGYIFAASYEGYAGIFLSNSPTCIELADDYAYGERNRTWNKAARLIRTTMIPEVKGVIKKDPTTGFIRSTTISRWTGLVNKALEQMESADEISGFSVYINPSQLVTEANPLKIQAKVVIDGILYEGDVELGLSNNV